MIAIIKIEQSKVEEKLPLLQELVDQHPSMAMGIMKYETWQQVKLAVGQLKAKWHNWTELYENYQNSKT